MTDKPVLVASNLKRHYTINRGLFAKPATVKALDGASFELYKNRTLAVVGESGCGKSTLARLITMIEPPTAGTLSINGEDIVGASRETLTRLRSKVQIVFQNPYGSLNPRQQIGAALEEPLLVNTKMTKAQRRDKAQAMMADVGLRPEHYGRYPHMFSGGQRQRIAIARALMLDPDILILDEPVSALDVSIQAQVLNLLNDLQQRLGLAYLFISHDLSVVKHIADEVIVMYLGRMVEHANRNQLFAEPAHPYSRALLSATPVPDPMRDKERIMLSGELPSPIAPPSGCTFHPRCPLTYKRCQQENPQLTDDGKRRVACHALFDQTAIKEPSAV